MPVYRTTDPALIVPTADELWMRLKASLPPVEQSPRQYVTEAGAAAAAEPVLPAHSGLRLPSQLLSSLGDPPPAAAERSAGEPYVGIGSYKKRSRARQQGPGAGDGSASSSSASPALPIYVPPAEVRNKQDKNAVAVNHSGSAAFSDEASAGLSSAELTASATSASAYGGLQRTAAIDVTTNDIAASTGDDVKQFGGPAAAAMTQVEEGQHDGGAVLATSGDRQTAALSSSIPDDSQPVVDTTAASVRTRKWKFQARKGGGGGDASSIGGT